jgi:hypothetical protein
MALSVPVRVRRNSWWCQGFESTMGKLELFDPGDEWTEQREAGLDTQQSRFTLTDLSDEWHFFNHGAFFSFAEFAYPGQDPVGDWYAKQPFGTEVMLQPFTKPVFNGITAPSGLGQLTWDHIVCGVRTELWPALFEFLGGVCSMNGKTDTFYSAFSGDIDVLDPVLAERHSIFDPRLPKVTVTVFCIDGNKDRWEIRPGISAVDPPRMLRVPPRKEIQDLAEAVFHGDVQKLQQHQNPAFQPHLDKYKDIQQSGPIILRPGDEGFNTTPNGG